MKKIITIDGKEYEMKSSAYTQFAYKDMTGRSFLKDMQKIIEVVENNEKLNDLSKFDEITLLILDITYIMVNEADEKQFNTREDFYKSIDSVYDDFKWIEDVILLACNPISRQLQTDISKIK